MSRWRDNLPCVHGPIDGCENHKNPGSIFYNKSISPRKRNLFSWTSRQPDEPPELDANRQIYSCLPTEAATIGPLARIHDSIPYSLAFYHVNAATSSARAVDVEKMDANSYAATSLEALTCRETHNHIQWKVTPKIGTDKTFLLEYDLLFTIANDTESSTNSRSYTKQLMVFSSLRSFVLCQHMTRKFYSTRMEVRNGLRYAGVEYGLSNVVGQTFKGEWRSEIGTQPPSLCCAMCFTDTWMAFALGGDRVMVRMLVHKDLGDGLDPYGPLWIPALRPNKEERKTNIRNTSDFGRIRAEFRGAS